MTRAERELELFDAWQAEQRARFIAGEERYGMSWPHKDCIREAREELLDLGNYAFLHWLRLRHLAELDAEPPRIYVAGPYSTGDIRRNVAHAAAVGQECIARGWAPFVPHTMYAGWEDANGLRDEDFIRLGLAWLRRCNAIVLFGDWTASPGTRRERNCAEKWGLAIHETVHDVPRLRK